MEPEEAAAAQAKGDLLRNFERILHDDPLIDEVGFLHPTQFHSLLVDSANKSAFQYFWCTDHKLAISSDILPELYRAARRAHSDTALNRPSSSPSASAAALIMMHSKALLILCPDLLTAWNSRKMVLSTNFNLSHLKDELRLCALILSYSPKNESTWSHRRWVIKRLAQRLQDMPELIDKESLLVKNIAEKSKMNYRAWRHRCWLIPYMKIKQVLDELNKSKKWTELHVADNCCFHYRRSLLLALLDGAANGKVSLTCQSEAHLMWKEELTWNDTLIRRYQGRESLWNHRRFLSQWWVQHLLSCEETSPSSESLADLFLSQEIHLLSDCLGAPGDEFGETRVQVELAALYILWISKQDAAVKGKVEERLQSVGSLKEVLARACPEKSRLWTHLLHC
ncbi:protein prenyltransferase alpha subunit repeat-containing protein 1 [Hordeum vulgare]|uniref:Protein prenyltransferase alpha subunit repeat-containing protein 1 n=1 Tax=Hordeum vulgare subsp. vulgare TaxID=112509 RepID=A0A8I6XDX6_HORVV|nr:protein prenyltransferase alpha subunit repeat-containing protein 1 isoform X1 [Hordeum vulgare subsp. vulgare]KAE8805683.1 protein prenyltransferase alpha subunit repeat-containing protein 1 [Hordeum vulgare]KAI4996913.1 hypothetical protein ZWY2020_052255 [Hordeum vulgare]